MEDDNKYGCLQRSGVDGGQTDKTKSRGRVRHGGVPAGVFLPQFVFGCFSNHGVWFYVSVWSGYFQPYSFFGR